LATKVVPGSVRVSSSTLRKKKSLLRMTGPPKYPPSLVKSKVPGLNAAPLASVPTRPSSRNQ
jgi:hypothetical protein